MKNYELSIKFTEYLNIAVDIAVIAFTELFFYTL